MAAVIERSSRLERSRPEPSSRIARFLASVHPELWVLTAALFLLNLHLFPALASWAPEPQIFLPGRWCAIEWWRLLTHAFVHGTWLHLLLDGVAFVLLYASLAGRRSSTRLLAVAACAAGSLFAAGLDPRCAELGYCGLSGVAHGLMALSALEMLSASRDSHLQAGLCLALVGGKCVLELITGHCAFEFLYGGLMGTPLVSSHTGGFLAGVACFGVAKLSSSRRRQASTRALVEVKAS